MLWQWFLTRCQLSFLLMDKNAVQPGACWNLLKSSHNSLILLHFDSFFTLSWLCFLFDLIFYVIVNNFSVMSRRVFLGWTSTKQGLMCLAQGHKAVMLVMLNPLTSRSWDKHSTTEPLRSHFLDYVFSHQDRAFWGIQNLGRKLK